MTERIPFEGSLYLPEAVEAAAAAYAEHAHIEVTPTAEGVVAVLTPVAGYELQEVAPAFCNHVLHETIARRRQTVMDEVA